MPREEALALVARLLDPEISESECDDIIEALTLGLRCPHFSDYLFFDHSPDASPEKAVDQALAYQPIAL
ncbi:e9imm peptide [Streptomyces venezuelae]|uniref:E9imm peptide n=1 Tax=Streptomyces venezuelae TaxID=54571 RepID=A0A5P2CZB1_STRVZ|nr:e9imm peptide [Streptomyces venezuelae]QES48234.1 e9imm peptide [Streptomyces venezuelae]